MVKHSKTEAAPPPIPQFQTNGPSPNVGNIGTNNYYGGGNNAMLSQYEEHSVIPANTVGGNGNGLNRSDSAISIGGGIYSSLSKVVVSSSGQWLGKNGKYYSFVRGANQYTGSSSGAFEAANNYKIAGNLALAANFGIGVYKTYDGYQMDGKHIGYNTWHAAASSGGGIIGGWAAGWAGAEAGAAVGVWADGVGAIPGAIGGFIFGYYGGQFGGAAGERAVNYYYKR